MNIAAIGEFVDDDTLFELCHCAFISDLYVENDILTITNELYEKYKSSYGMVQKGIERDGVDISGLLQTC